MGAGCAFELGRLCGDAGRAMAVACKHGVIGGVILMATIDESRADVDWKPMMTVAERKHDAQGNLLPLQSYDETIRRGMAFLLDEHLKWFKGAPETLLDEKGQTQMPWVYYSNLQQNGAPFTASVDRFVSYPAFHHAMLIRTFIGYGRYSGDKRPLAEAVTRSAGTGASCANPFSSLTCSTRCLTSAINLALVGPKLLPAD